MSQRTDPHRFFSLFFFFFHRFSSVLIAPFAFATLLWEWEIFIYGEYLWQGVECREMLERKSAWPPKISSEWPLNDSENDYVVWNNAYL